MRIRIKMPAGIRSANGIDTALLNALFWESEKCATVMDRLSHLRRVLSREAQKELNDVRNEIDSTRRAMLGFADLFPLHTASIHAFLNHLDMALPSVSKSLDDIQVLCNGRGRFTEERWEYLYDVMFNGSGKKYELEKRFNYYAKFFDTLSEGITQSSKFDWKKAERLRLVIMDLREENGQDMPAEFTTVFFPFNQLPAARSRSKSQIKHWAEEAVDRKPPFWTLFGKEGRSESFGPYLYWDAIGIPEKSKLLFRRTFRNEELSFSVYTNYNDKLPYVLLRTAVDNTPYYECRPLHEIRIMRSDTKLHLSRWSVRQRTFVHWAVLHFKIFEELVVIHCTLLSLKAQTSLKPQPISNDEAVFRDDERIWEKDIKDGGVRHKLAIYRDHLTGTKRLYACVASGERRPAYTPAWTIFFTNRLARPEMECIGDYKLIVYNTTLYTFGDRYLTAKHDARHFEITFRHRDDAHALKHLFDASFRALQRQSR